MKYLLLILILVLIVWFLARQRKGRDDRPGDAPRERIAENIVVCAHCRLRIPESESIRHEGRHYCCDEHRRLDSP